MVGQDKRLFKEMLQSDGPGTTPHDVQALSPPVNDDAWVFPSSSPVTPMMSRHYSYSTSGGSDQEMDTVSFLFYFMFVQCRSLFFFYLFTRCLSDKIISSENYFV